MDVCQVEWNDFCTANWTYILVQKYYWNVNNSFKSCSLFELDFEKTFETLHCSKIIYNLKHYKTLPFNFKIPKIKYKKKNYKLQIIDNNIIGQSSMLWFVETFFWANQPTGFWVGTFAVRITPSRTASWVILSRHINILSSSGLSRFSYYCLCTWIIILVCRYWHQTTFLVAKL